MKQRTGLILLLLILLAFGLRLHRLGEQSLWSDEGLSLYRARLPIQEILANVITVDGVDTQDTNPPLFFLLLHAWRTVVGESVLALRLLGVLVGVLAVPLIYALGRIAFGNETGLWAALFIAISPFHVWQSQDMRNYSLLLSLNLLSVLGLFRYLLPAREKDQKRWFWLIVWAVGGLAGIYTHYFGFFVFAFGLAALVVCNLKRPWVWVGMGIATLATLPLIPVALARLGAGQQVDFTYVPLNHLLAIAASVYSVGMRPTIIQPAWRVIPVVALAAAGIIVGVIAGKDQSRQEIRQRRLVTGLTIGYLIIPLAFLVFLSRYNPLYNGPRHLFTGLPPFLLLVAAGTTLVTRRWRWLSLSIAVACLASQLAWLRVQFTDPALTKDDMQSTAAYLTEVSKPDDVIILHDTLIGFVFDYYYRGQAPWIAIPEYAQHDVELVTQNLSNTGRQTQGRIWFLSEPEPRTGFPREALGDWANGHWTQLSSHRFPSLWLHLKLDGYLADPLPAGLPDKAVKSQATWTDQLELQGYQFEPTIRSGRPWWPTFYWSRLGDDVQDVTLSLRLTDDTGRTWAQVDQPLWRFYPPDQWPLGQLVRHDQEFYLPAGLPPGDYQLWLRLLDSSDQQPWPLADGSDAVLLPTPLQIEAATSSDLLAPAVNQLDASFAGALELVGFQLPEEEFRPGYPIPLDLYWLVNQAVETDYRLSLQLVSQDGEVIGQSEAAPSRDNYPTSQWQPGELILGKAGILVPPQAAAGTYTLRAALVDPTSEEALAVRDGWLPWGKDTLTLQEIQVAEWPLQTTLPALETTLQADFGDPATATLHGYDLSQSADGLQITLFWRSVTATKNSYSVFVHLVDRDENIRAQGDDVPVNGIRPTTSWRPGEIIIDTHQVLIDPDEIDQDDQLLIGLYDPLTDTRLPISVNGTQQPTNRLVIEVRPSLP